MRNLNKDEKNYINKSLLEKLTDIECKIRMIDTKSLIKDDVLNNPIIVSAITYLKTMFTEEEIKKGMDISSNYNMDQGYFKVNLKNYTFVLNITVDLSKELSDKLEEYDKLRSTLSRVRRGDILNIEKYYILFTTWEAPNSERLNKINELIELIYKDITT